MANVPIGGGLQKPCGLLAIRRRRRRTQRPEPTAHPSTVSNGRITQHCLQVVRERAREREQGKANKRHAAGRREEADCSGARHEWFPPQRCTHSCIKLTHHHDGDRRDGEKAGHLVACVTAPSGNGNEICLVPSNPGAVRSLCCE